MFMRVFLCGLMMFFMRSSFEKMICIFDFFVIQSLKVLSNGFLFFIFVLFNFDQYVFIKNSCVQVVDQFNEEVYKMEILKILLCGLVFDI